MFSPEFWVAAIGCIITCIGLIVAVTKSITGLKIFVIQELQLAINKIREENNKENLRLRREIGETLNALKEHIRIYEIKHQELELYIRDNYIEVPTFSRAIEDLKNTIAELFRKLDGVLAAKNTMRHG